jgi:hypothetical protein
LLLKRAAKIDYKQAKFVSKKQGPERNLCRNLKASLLDTERYKEELRDLTVECAALTSKVQGIRGDIKHTKEELNKCKMEGAMPKGKHLGPKFNKDTKVVFLPHMWLC